MPGQRPILAMAFIASLGFTFEVLACVLPKNNSNFWPLVILLFYILLPIPALLSRRIIKETLMGMNETSAKKTRDMALFFTAGIMVSSFALPIVMARSPSEHPTIAPIQAFLVEIGNVLCYLTMGLFSVYFKPLGGTI